MKETEESVRNSKDPDVRVQLTFLESLESVFNRFLTLLQKEEPLIHILNDQLSKLVRTLMRHFLKADEVEEKTGKKLHLVDVCKSENELPNQMLMIGMSTRTASRKMKPEQQKGSIMEMRKYCQNATKHLFNKIPLAKEILKYLTSLHPLLKKAERGVRAIVRAAKNMSQVISQEMFSLLTDEWMIYQAQEIPESWY